MPATSDPQVFLFLSWILNREIFDAEGRVLGRIGDLMAVLSEPYPVVTDALVRRSDRRESLLLSWRKIREEGGRYVAADAVPADWRSPAMRNGDILLREALLDKQVVDTDGAKIRRVNDLQFLKIRGGLHLVHVDVGFRGLMRRVGLEKAVDKLLMSLFDYTLPDQFISWKFIQPISTPDLLRLKIAQDRLSQLHPADLADIIEELNVHQRTAVFQTLDVEMAAETLEETDPKIQVKVIEDMPPASASDIIEEMSLSEATDLIGELSKDKAEVILKEMEKESAEDIKELLAHPEEKAGGLMTTSFIRFAPNTTAADALAHLRREAEEVELIYYAYVVDSEDHLLGAIGLRDLLVASDQCKVDELMDTRIVTVGLDADKSEIADHFAKYGIIAIPVVDKDGKIEGVIDFKNLLEAVAPELGK